MQKLGLALVVAVLSSALTAAALTLPALAGDGDEDRALPFLPALGDGRKAIEEFEACMKTHGFDLSGEVTVRITPDGVTVNGEKVDAAAFEKAQAECGPPFALPKAGHHALPGLEVPEKLRERMEKLHECLGLEKEDETT